MALELVIGFKFIEIKLYHLNFHPLEVVSRYRDPQLQVGDIVTDIYLI